MRHVDVLWSQFPGRTLSDSAQPELCGSECGVPDATAQARSRAGEEDRTLLTGQHQPGRLARGQETGVAGHFPDLAKNTLSCFGQGKVDVGADVEDADGQRRNAFGLLKKSNDILLLARVQRAPDTAPSLCLNLMHQRRQLLAVAPAGEDRVAACGESACDCAADVVAGADDRHSSFGRRSAIFIAHDERLDIHAKLQRLTTTSEDAWTLMAQNVGAVMLARAIPDEKLQLEVLSALRKAGEKMLADKANSSSNSAT